MRSIVWVTVIVLFSQLATAAPMTMSSLSIAKQMKKNRITGPISGIMGMSCPDHTGMLVYKYQNVSKSNFYDGSDLANHPMYKDYVYKQQHVFGFRYGVSSRFEVKMVGNFFKR